MKKLLIACACLASLIVRGQDNLVPNAGFEDSIPCTNTPGTYRPAQWYSPTYGSPDYYVASSTGNAGCFDSGPSIWGGGSFSNSRGFQLPNTGKAYAGFGLNSEFLAVQLTDSLHAGKKYVVSCYVSVAEISPAGTEMLNFCFMHTQMTGYLNNGPSFAAFLDSLHVDAGNQAGHCILDTLGWVEVRDTFIAEGGERFMIVHAEDFLQAQYCPFDTTVSPWTYMYFDDFDVHCLDCIANVPSQPALPTGISVRPNIINPDLGEHFRITGDFTSGATIELYNMFGQRISAQSASGTEATLTADGVPPGAYLLSVITDAGIRKQSAVYIVR